MADKAFRNLREVIAVESTVWYVVDPVNSASQFSVKPNSVMTGLRR